ncbi:cyclin-T1-3-like [Tasmannia lanceolata]|uniref:cyclin-T1-3-like n=1 Tax=Tasmannia lanceolata TaxID=3420 RepID=UPI004062AF62
MAGHLPGNPSQHGMVRDGAYNICQIMSEAPNSMRSRWYHSRKEIEDHSPSRKDGIDLKRETQLRKLYCSFLQDLGIKLRVPQVTIATAMMFCHRFYLHQSHAKNEWQTIATVSMFLACKVEETPRMLMDVVVVAYETMYRRDPVAAQRIKQKEIYEKQKEIILIGERLLLSTIAFDVNIQHPYKPLVTALKNFKIAQNDVAKVAWNFVNDWLRTTLCLQYKPHYIAAGSLFLAAKFHKVKLPSERGMIWWQEFDVTPRQLEEVTQQMLELLEQNKRAVVPSTRTNAPGTGTPVVPSTRANAPGTGTPVFPSTRANAPGTGTPVVPYTRANAPGTGTPVFPSTRVNAPGMGTPVVAEKPASRIPQTLELLEHNRRAAVPSTLAKAPETPLIAQKAVSRSPHSCVLSGSVGTSELTHEVGRCESANLVSHSLGGQNSVHDNTDVVEKGELQCQTSECGSAHSVVEDGEKFDEGEDQSRTESAQIVGSKIIAVSEGLSEIDKDRIKARLKRRIQDRAMNKKAVAADELDCEAWIESELENGIELEVKKSRLV